MEVVSRRGPDKSTGHSAPLSTRLEAIFAVQTVSWAVHQADSFSCSPDSTSYTRDWTTSGQANVKARTTSTLYIPGS